MSTELFLTFFPFVSWETAPMSMPKHTKQNTQNTKNKKQKNKKNKKQKTKKQKNKKTKNTYTYTYIQNKNTKLIYTKQPYAEPKNITLHTTRNNAHPIDRLKEQR